MRISDWSSDVCSSDLRETHRDIAQRRREKSHRQEAPDVGVIGEETVGELAERIGVEQRRADRAEFDGSEDTLIDQWILDYAERETRGIDEPVAKRDEWKSVVKGKRGSVRVDLGRRRNINIKTQQEKRYA